MIVGIVVLLPGVAGSVHLYCHCHENVALMQNLSMRLCPVEVGHAKLTVIFHVESGQEGECEDARVS